MMMAGRCKSNGSYDDMDILWKKYFRDPSQWYDNRSTKASSRSPDFKHKITKESLWIDGSYNPSWVCKELMRTLEVKHEELSVEKEKNDKEVVNNEKGIAFVALLKDCAKNKDLNKGARVHADMLNRGLLENNPYVGNTLVSMYAKCGALAKARQVFDELSVRDVVSWNALIAGYAQQGQGEEALNCFQRMQSQGLSPNAVTFICILKACGSTGAIGKGKQIHDEIVSKGLLGKNRVLGNALVDMYAKCGALAKAQQMFDELSVRDVVSWNALIAGYAQQGQGEEALNCFQSMQSEGLSPDAVTFSCILKACGSTGAIGKGKQIHDEIVSKGLLGKDKVLGNALVDMYAKCGALAKAQQVFDELSIRDVVSWSALIAGYAQQGQAEEALNCFRRMQSEGISPNAVTFLCVLNSCSHSGLLDEAQMYFANMSEKYEITPDLEHHTCMVDVFGRAGQFDKAMAVIKKMPSSDYLPVWGALLGACQKWGNVKLGRFAFEKQVQLDNAYAAAYVSMANIYASAGMHEDAEKVEAMRVKNGAWEKPGHSVWVDVSGNVRSFFVGDRKHTQIKGIYAKLQDISLKMSQGGYSSSLPILGVTKHFL